MISFWKDIHSCSAWALLYTICIWPDQKNWKNMQEFSQLQYKFYYFQSKNLHIDSLAHYKYFACMCMQFWYQLQKLVYNTLMHKIRGTRKSILRILQAKNTFTKIQSSWSFSNLILFATSCDFTLFSDHCNDDRVPPIQIEYITTKMWSVHMTYV